jgi:hypothetical protein
MENVYGQQDFPDIVFNLFSFFKISKFTSWMENIHGGAGCPNALATVHA